MTKTLNTCISAPAKVSLPGMDEIPFAFLLDEEFDEDVTSLDLLGLHFDQGEQPQYLTL